MFLRCSLELKRAMEIEPTFVTHDFTAKEFIEFRQPQVNPEVLD